MMWGQRCRDGLVDVARDGRRRPRLLGRHCAGDPGLLRPGASGRIARRDPLTLLKGKPPARGEVSLEETEQRRRLIVGRPPTATTQ